MYALRPRYWISSPPTIYPRPALHLVFSSQAFKESTHIFGSLMLNRRVFNRPIGASSSPGAIRATLSCNFEYLYLDRTFHSACASGNLRVPSPSGPFHMRSIVPPFICGRSSRNRRRRASRMVFTAGFDVRGKRGTAQFADAFTPLAFPSVMNTMKRLRCGDWTALL